MNVFRKYIVRQNIIEDDALLLPYVKLTVVIPCYDEPEVLQTLQSLWTATYEDFLHTVLVLNHREDSPQKVKEQNDKTFRLLSIWKQQNETKTKRLTIIKKVFDSATGGVGDARKLGMDFAIKQYAKHKKDGVLVSLDADTLCEPNYLTEIAKHYEEYPRTNALVIRYQHRTEGLAQKYINGIMQYELYLRYMSLAYRYIGHPHYFHTIGSAFAVKASAYCKQGGMNHRQAGEDFYFLQKVFQLGNCCELKTACVYPSGRISERVPFGTGRAVAEFTAENKTELETYAFSAFEELKYLFDRHLEFFKIDKEAYEHILYKELGGLVKSWLIASDFFQVLENINNNCASQTTFSNKFFNTFSIFQIIKYLNFCHQQFIRKTGIVHNISQLPDADFFNFSSIPHLLESMREQMAR